MEGTENKPVRVNNIKAYQKAYRLFLTGRYKIAVISRMSGVCEETVRSWRNDFGWERDRGLVQERIRSELIEAQVIDDLMSVKEINEMQRELGIEMTGAKVISKEGLSKEIREWEKLKILKSGGATERTEHTLASAMKGALKGGGSEQKQLATNN